MFRGEGRGEERRGKEGKGGRKEGKGGKKGEKGGKKRGERGERGEGRLNLDPSFDPTNTLYHVGAHKDLIKTIQKEMNAFQVHHNHVIYHKDQMHDLLANLPTDEIVIKADFIQNIIH